MICNVDKTWTLESQDIQGLNIWVAKLMKERAEDQKINKFDPQKFVKYIYDEINNATKDEQKALAFAREVPSALLLAGVTFPDIRKSLKAKGYDTSVVEDIQDRFANSLQDVANFLVEISPNNAQSQASALNTAATVQPGTAPNPSVLALPSFAPDLPDTALSTTGREIEERKFYYDFLKNLRNLFFKVNGRNSNGTIAYVGIKGGIRVSATLGSNIPIDQIYEDQKGPNAADQMRNVMFTVITDSEGKFVYFDENFRATTADKGKLVYFPMRTIPKFTVENGVRVFNLGQVEGSSIRPIAETSDTEEGREVAKMRLQNQYNTLQNMYEYLLGNTAEVLPLSIESIDGGAVEYTPEVRTPLNTVTNIGDLKISLAGDVTEDFKYVKIPNIESKIRFIMGDYSTDTAESVANLLLSDIYLPNGKKMTVDQRIKLIQQFTRLGADGLLIDTKSKKIFIAGEVLDTTDKESAKQKIVEYLTRTLPLKTKKGVEIEINNQFYFNEDLYKAGGMINMFKLNQRPDGSFDFLNNNVDYNQWLKANSFISIKTDDSGNISEKNGYVRFELMPSTADKIKKEATGFAAERQKAGIKATKTVTPTSVSTPTKGNVSEEMKKLIQNKFKNKLFSMRHDSYAATQKQIKTAEKWFNETVITYKDENGNVVKAKLSDVVPLKVLFNFANAAGDIRAQWTKAGITLFNGSDYTDLYHESWHAFTQLFMSPEERQKLYDEVKKLGREIRYYDHSAGSWKKMNTADLDFSNLNHILYAEEFLADEYRNYAMNKGTVTGAIKTFFKKILNMLKALFKGTSIQNSYDVPVLKEAFDNLHVGNLVNYTFNQQNIQFDVLNSGITALTPEEGKVNTVDISTALEFSESLYGYLSEFVDTLNTGDILGADAQTSVFTYKLLSDPDIKKMALQYAKERFEQDIVYFQNLLDNAESEFEKLRYERLISDLSFAYDNFGDFESGNFEDGVIGFFNKRTGFFNISLENAEEDPEEATDVVDADGNKQEGKDKDGSSPFNKNNDKSTYQRVDPVMKFIFGSLYDREDATADNPEGLIANRLFGKRLLDPASAFTVISSVVGNAPTKDKMFEALFFESEKTNTFGMPTRKALIIKQFLDKVGTPTTTTLESLLLWNKTFHNLRYDRLEGVQVLIKKSEEGIREINVGTSMGFVKSLEKSIKDRWLIKNPSPFARKNENGEYYLDLKALAKKYTRGTMAQVQQNPDRLFDFFNDFGIPLTPSIEAAKKIVEYNILNELWSYNLKAWLSDEYNKNEVKSLDQLLFSKFKEKGAPQSQEGVFKRLLNIEAEYNIDALSEMIYDSMQNLRSEKFSPSSASNIINDLNASQSYQDVIQNNPQGILDVYNISKNPRVKTSQLFQKMFGKNLQERQSGAKRAIPVKLKLETVLGTQLLELDGASEKFVAGLNSADSDLTTSYIRDFFLYSYTGYAEAYKHADKNLAFLLSVTGGDPGDARYVDPKLFVKGIQTGNSDGRQKANAIILDYIGSELEFIRKTQADYVTGENPQDIIIGKSNLKELGNSFKTFHDILTDDIKAELIANDAIQTVEDFRAYLSNNFDFKNTLIQELNNYFDKVIAKDKEILERSGLANNKAVLASLGQSRAFSSSNLNDVFDASVEHFSYISFIHKHEMATLIYGDPVYFNHDNDEHMKRVPLFFATGKVALSDSTTEEYLAKNPGTYANSEWFKKSGLKAPTRSHYTGHIINTSVLEDPKIDSPYFDYYVNIAVSKGMSREAAEQKYDAYKGMKIGDGFAWMTFDAYRALEIKYDNWNPAKQDLYNKIISNEELTDKDQENISAFFPVKKLQYSGWLKTTNLPVPGTHKFAVGPLIPNVIAGSRLESLHNKMVSQEISYAVLQSGSKTASIGKDGKLSKFYTQEDGQDPAFTDPNYVFHKNVIYSPFLKEQVKSDDKFKGKIGMPSQLRKIAISGIYEFGYPVDFKPGLSDAERRKAWQKLSNDKKKEESPLYRLEQTYLESVDKMIKVAETQLKMELGYKDPNAKSKDTSYNLSKLADFFKKQLTAQDISEYDLNFIKIGSTGQFEIPLDLISDPVRLEKLVVSVANKRVYKHMVNGDSFVQTPMVGFEKFAKPTDADIITYGSRGLRFYNVDPITGRTLPMQVKISLHGQYFKLLDLNHNDGKKIETLQRLNDMIKNEEWLATNDNRKMITMVAARIPTQAENFIEVMEVAEFLPAAAGPIMILPEEIVAKNGSDYDIDKLYVLKPVIKNNRGNVEYIKAKKTKKKYETIVKDKAILKQKINDVYAEYDEYIEEVKKQKFELTPEQKEELDLINSSYKPEVRKLRKEINRAYDNLINNTDLAGPDLEAYQNLEDSLQSKIDSISQEKRNFFKRLFGEFIDDTIRRRNAEIEEFNVELRQLEREAFSYKSLGYQNEMMEAMTGILLSPEYFEKLTAGTDTSFFTNEGGVVGKFTGVNREFRKTENYINPNTGKMSPTRTMENYYNNSKAEAISVGKGGIGMVATDITFSALAKESDLSMSYEYTVQPKTVIKQFLLVPHNTVKDDEGRDVISFAGGKDAGELERQVSEVLSQIANGYLEIAKNDFLYDVNIIKELETEAAMLLEQGVPLETVVGLLSQPLVREYLRLAKSYNSPIKVATGEIKNRNFAKSQALVDVLKNFAPTYLNLVEDKDTGEIKYLNPGYDKIASKISQDLFGTDPINISELEERSKTKLDELTDEDLRIFLHTVQIMVMARQYKDLKYATNFDTVTSSSVIDVINRRKKILALSGAFPREALERLVNNTILKSFSNQQIIVDAARSILPVRNNDAVLKFISENYSSQELGDTDVRERMIRDFSNNLPHYIFFNYQPGINDLGTSYKSYTTNKELVVKPQALLRFGAFVDPSTQELLIDENFIREQYNKNMFSDPNMAYGEGILAKMPSDMFSGYKENGYAMYRNFVIEREIARSMYPYDTIIDNGEFRLFRLMRNKEISLPDLYEEFIRNKGLENALIDKALFKSVNVYSKYGIFSYADTYRFILSQFDITQNYSVLDQLYPAYDPATSSRYVSTKTFIKDGMLETAYKSQMKRLADPAERKVESEIMNDAISTFFAKMPMIGFVQAGNNAMADYYIGSVVDIIAVAEYMRPAVDKFLQDMEGPSANAILSDYKSKLNAKGMLGYYNFSSSTSFKSSAATTTAIVNGKRITFGQSAEYVNHSGAAKGADYEFNIRGADYGTSNMNYHNQDMLDRAVKGEEKDLVLDLMQNNQQALITDESEYAMVVNRGAERLGKLAKKPETINKLGRNWYQVKNSDALFAVVEDFYTRPESNQKDMSNVAGGTGWAVAYAAEKIDGKERPIYVYSQATSQWYSYNYNKGVFEQYQGTPTLTKNFAGIGTRKLKENGKRAIKDLFENTFGISTQAPISVQVKPGVSELFKANPELANIGTAEQYSAYLNTIFPDSQVKDIVYRGGEKEDSKLFQYFTKNPSEAYIYSKANITKGGNITERNPIAAINKQAETYTDNRYGKGTYEILSLPDNWQSIIYDAVDISLVDIDYNLTEKGKKLFDELQEKNNKKELLLKSLDKKDIDLLKSINIVKNLYDTIKIESEADLTKPYDDVDYQNNIGKYNKARKYIDDILGAAGIRQDIGKITANVINITNPYKDEIAQEDLTNDKDAYKGGYDGAFLMDGDHFLVKSSTNQIQELGTKQDIEGFKNFVSGRTSTVSQAPASTNKVLEGDIFALPGIPVITTNLGGVHGAGLAQAAASKGLITKGDGAFKATNNVVQLPVKLKWSDDMSMNNNMMLLQDSLNSLVEVANSNPQNNYLLPLAGLGHGEGSIEEILPLLIKAVQSSSNIQLVLPAEGVSLGRQGTVRKDYTRENMPKIKEMLSKAGLGFASPPKTLDVTSSVQISDPQKVFQDFVVAQSGPQMKVDYNTGEVVEFAKIYKESSIIQDGKYGLTINNINTLFNENPDTVFVYDDVYVKEEDRNSLLPQSNNRLAWRMGLKTGNSFAISTKLASGAAPTDEQYEKMKSIIDAQIEALKALRDSGKKIVFSSYGVAQNWAGFEFVVGTMRKKDSVPAPTAFVYLSKRLFDEFGYRNPRFDAVTTQTELKEDVTAGLGGVEYYQENYKNQGIQSITDNEIVEFIKMCKGL